VEGDGETTLQYELVRILPTRLSRVAFLLWDNLPAVVQSDYTAVKERLKEAFGRKQFLDLSARPRAAHESLVVYAAEINRLVLEVFPNYGQNATREGKFSRFLAGLDLGLRAKCHEQGATDIEEALVIAERCENVREAVKLDYVDHRGAAGCAATVEGPAAAVQSVTDYGGLHGAVNKLTEEMRDMRRELKVMAEENQRLRASTGGEWRGSHSPVRGRCYCICGGAGCQSRPSRELQRGRSPDRRFSSPRDDRRPFTRPRSQENTASAWSPGRRSPSPGRRTYYEEEAPSRWGVPFASPHGEDHRHRQGNAV